ncbi:MAG: hypothetical protein WEF50_16505 [Myxococcota bacterium]
MGRAARGLSGVLATFALWLANDAAAECPELRSLLRATQAQPSVSWVSQFVRMVIAASDDDGLLSTPEMERLYVAATDAYSPLELVKDIEQSLGEPCNAEATASANAFYRSPTGVKFIRGALELLSESGGEREAAWFEKLREEGVSSGRLEAVRSTRSASLVYDAPPRVRLALVRPLALVTIRAVAREKGLPEPSQAEISDGIARDSSLRNAYFDLQSDLALLFATRDLSLAELQEFRSFLGSSTGVWYRESTSRAFEGAVERAGERFIASAAPARAGSDP